MGAQNRSVFVAAIWTLMLRWATRLIGLISTVILARILMPQDFGLVAMAMVFSALIEAAFEVGVMAILIQRPELQRADYDTAWTLRLGQGGLSCVLMLLLSPYAVDYFQSPELALVIYCVAVLAMIRALENIAIVDFHRNLEFDKDFRLGVVSKLASFALTIVLALWWRNYWALIAGMFCNTLARVMLSYTMHPFRPRLSLARIDALWRSSFWFLARGIAVMLQNRLDQIVVGGQFGQTTLGYYTIADEVASLPTTELLSPVNRALFPGFANLQNDALALARAFSLGFGSIVLIGVPASIGVMLVAEDLIAVMLGPQWAEAVPFVEILSLVCFAVSMRQTAATLLVATGRVSWVAVGIWLQIALLLVLLYINASALSPELVAILRLIAGISLALVFLTLIVTLCDVPIRLLATQSWRPIIAAACMVLALRVQPLDLQSFTALRLLSEVLVGVLVYSGAVIALWKLAGTPEQCPEHFLLQKLSSALRKLRRR